MKRNVWITIITAITVCCVAGGTFFNLGIRGNRFFLKHGDMISTDSDLEAFEAVRVDADLMSISVTAGEHFYLSCEYTDGLEPVYEVKNGILSIKQRQYKKWGINDARCSLSLTIPARTVMDTINVKTAMGDVQLEGISASKCEILNNLGNCTLKKCSFDESDLENNLGEISISDTSLGKAEVNNDMGTVRVDACTFASLDITATMGEAEVDAAQDLGKYDIDLEADLGDVKVNGYNEGTKYHQPGDAGTLEITTNMGNIRLDYRKKE